MNHQIILLKLSTLIILVLMSACSHPNQHQEIPPIISFKEYLPELEKIAKDWRPDAALMRAFIDFEATDYSPHLIFASFGTNSGMETLILRVGLDGEIKSEILENSKKQVYLPIYMDDIKIDSAEALELLLDEKGRRYLSTQEHRICSSLKLDRERTIPGDPVLWYLTLRDCSFRKNNYLYLNATTGERVIVDKSPSKTE